MVSPPEPAAGTSTGGSWMTSSCAPESTRTVASGSVSGPGPRRAASSATRKRTARMPAAPGVEVRTTYRLACVLATAGRLLPECRVRGLGLATVYGVVKRSGGFVWVYSEPGLGTSVKIYLPLPRAPGPAPVLPTPAPIVSLRGTETILLVEDEDAVRTVARQVLQRHGYAVIEVARPEDALALADTSQAVDLLLTDIVMPGLGGRTLAAQFTARRLGTRVLFMSGYPAAAIGRHQMLERGLAFLQKPFSAAALAQKVREVLG